MSLAVLSIVPQRLCSNCEHGYLGPGGVFCVEFQEPINDERAAAADCPEFDPQTNGTPPPQRPEINHTVEVVSKVDSEMGGKGVEVVSSADYGALVDMCDRYLANRNCVLWGQPFEIVSPKGRREAAEWLATQIKGLGSPVPQAPG